MPGESCIPIIPSANLEKSLGYTVSEVEHRDYGQTEFFLTDDDGYSHCFGGPTERKIDISRLDRGA